MSTPAGIRLENAVEAIEFLITNETLLRACRTLYGQVLNNELAIEPELKQHLLATLEDEGLALANMKQHVLDLYCLRVFPTTIEFRK